MEVRASGGGTASDAAAGQSSPGVEVGATLLVESEWDIGEVGWSCCAAGDGSSGKGAAGGWEVVADGGSGGVRIWKVGSPRAQILGIRLREGREKAHV